MALPPGGTAGQRPTAPFRRRRTFGSTGGRLTPPRSRSLPYDPVLRNHGFGFLYPIRSENRIPPLNT